MAKIAKKRQRLHTDERRAQLLQIGLQEFSSKSYDDVNLDEVAKRSKISKGLLFHYFRTKRAFYTETIQIAANQLLEQTELKKDFSPLERLDHSLSAYINYVDEHAKAYVTLLRGGIGSDPKILKIVQSTRDRFADRLLEGLDERQPSAKLLMTIRGWIGFVEFTSLEWAESRSVSARELKQIWIKALLSLSDQNARE